MDFAEMSFSDSIKQVLSLQQTEKLKKRIFGSFNIQLLECDEESRTWADYYYKTQDVYLNPYDGVHGGVACTLADSCMGATIVGATQVLPSTTDISISYLNPMVSSGFRIHVEIKKIGRQLAACTCDIYDMESNKLCVNVMGKFILVRKDILADKEASKYLK